MSVYTVHCTYNKRIQFHALYVFAYAGTRGAKASDNSPHLEHWNGEHSSSGTHKYCNTYKNIYIEKWIRLYTRHNNDRKTRQANQTKVVPLQFKWLPQRLSSTMPFIFPKPLPSPAGIVLSRASPSLFWWPILLLTGQLTITIPTTTYIWARNGHCVMVEYIVMYYVVFVCVSQNGIKIREESDRKRSLCMYVMPMRIKWTECEPSEISYMPHIQFVVRKS